MKSIRERNKILFRRLWVIMLAIVLTVSLAMVAFGVITYRNLDKPLICVAASVYDDGTVIERPCPDNVREY